MRTSWGDDFLVDPANTWLALENKLGSFTPLLSECRSVAPLGNAEGDWRVELETGTVLIGRMRDQSITVALPMGPDEVSVPLSRFVSLRLESWGPLPAVAASPPPAVQVPEEPVRRTVATQAAPVAARGAGGGDAAGAADDDGWFENDALEAAKANSP
jgi:hypothetical protein